MIVNGQILNLQQFSARYGSRSDVMFVFNAIVNSLRPHIKTIETLYNDTYIHDYLVIGNLDTDTISRKDIMKLITNPEIPYSENSWKRQFGDNFDKKFWSLPFECTKETKLQVMQWKIMHEIFPSNILLKKMKLKDSENCGLCGERDTVIHFFYECICVKSVWKELEKLTLQKTSQPITFTSKDILLGMAPNKLISKNNLRKINSLILIGKHVISKVKYGIMKNFSLLLEHELVVRKLN